MSLDHLIVIRRVRRRRSYRTTTSGHRVIRPMTASFVPLPPPTAHHRNDAILGAAELAEVMPTPHRYSA